MEIRQHFIYIDFWYSESVHILGFVMKIQILYERPEMLVQLEIFNSNKLDFLLKSQNFFFDSIFSIENLGYS